MADTPEQARARERLDAIIDDRIADRDVDEGPIFHSTGWRVRGKVFAFATRTGALIVKLPESRVAELVAAEAGDPMMLGTRTMREWVRIPADADWAPFVVEAHAFGAAAAQNTSGEGVEA